MSCFCFQKYILYLLRDLAKELGWDESKDDSHLTRQVLSLSHWSCCDQLCVRVFKNVLQEKSEIRNRLRHGIVNKRPTYFHLIVYCRYYRYLRVVVLGKVASYEDLLPERERQYTDRALEMFNDWLYGGKV